LAQFPADLDQQRKAVAAANEPTVMPDEISAGILELADRSFPDYRGDSLTLLTPEEARVLSITRGSLTPEEYEEIQSHVWHTYQFRKQIPWTQELRRVPEIARSHHEKLDGSGYPAGWRAAAIPIQTRVVTSSDIFDALTARDRPYKPALPVDRALDILGQERRAGALDGGPLPLLFVLRPSGRRLIGR